MPGQRNTFAAKILSVHEQLVLSVLFSILVVILVALCYHQGVLRQFDNSLYDFFFRWRGTMETSGKIVLVLMDDDSAIELGKEKGDWSREHTAVALENLCAAGAEIIGIDMVMSDPDPDPAYDEMLTKVIDECNNIVLPRVAATQSGVSRVALKSFQRGMIGEGFIDAQLDSDGVWRRLNYFNVQLLPDGAMQVFPSFALELVRTFLSLDVALSDNDPDFIQVGTPDKYLKLPRPELLINFHGDYTAFKSISFSDVVHDRFDPDQVRGRLVLIGSSLAVNKDKFSTPFSKSHIVAQSLKEKFGMLANQGFSQKDLGVSCIANAAETMLEGKIIRPLSKKGVYLLIILLGGICLIFYNPKLNMITGFLILGISLALITGIRYLLFSQQGLVFDSAPLLGVTAVQFIAGGILQKRFAKKKIARVTALFGRYVSKSVANELVQGDIDEHFKGTQKDLTILFSDLRNFTALSEELSPKEISALLNTYFGTMIPLVFRHKGTLDKLVGDMIMAFFGAPLTVPDHPAAAVRCALEMQQKLKLLRSQGSVRGAEKLWSGIGINTGQVIVGNLGSEDFIDYTVIGDAVNIASRLEGLNKLYGTQIIISESTRIKLQDQFLVRKLDTVRLKGKQEPIIIYELLGELSTLATPQKEMVGLFESGLSEFQSSEFDSAREIFQKILTRFPDDGPSKLYLERISLFRQTPPGKEWDGVTLLNYK